MAITQLTKDLNHVQALDDLPNDNTGMTAAQVKATFDQAPNEIKDYINNTLIPQLPNEFLAANGDFKGTWNGAKMTAAEPGLSSAFEFHNNNYSKHRLNVMDFGAKGSGTVDDTAAVQAAIDYVYNNLPNSVFNADWNQRGGVVYLPAGTYKCGTLYLKEGVHLKGHSVDSTKIICSGIVENTYAITNKYKDTIDGYRNVSVEDLSVVGGDIYLLKAYNSNVKNVSVYNSTNGILMQLSTFLKIENFRAYNCTKAFSLVANAGAGPCTSVYIKDSWFAHCGSGITLDGSTNWIDTVTIENVIIEYCTDPLTIYGGTKDNHGITIKNLHLEQNVNYIKVQDSSVIFENLYCDDTSKLNLVLITPSHNYSNVISLKNATANVYVQPNVLSTIYYENIYQINDNGTAKYISLDNSDIYSNTSGTEILKNAYKYFKRKDIATGEKAIFELSVLSDEGYWIGKAYFNYGNITTLIPDGNSVTTLTQNAAGTVATTAGGTNAVFKVKLIC